MEKKNLSVPAAIIVAGIIIAGAIFMTQGGIAKDKDLSDKDAGNTKEEALNGPSPVTTADHILGNPKAPITIIEFSDTECPFCKRFHDTMEQIMDKYGKTGKVAWVYRHFPLDSIHSKARKEAEATECAAELGGNQKFWDYTGRLFDITPANNGLDPAQLPEIAEFVGLDKVRFNECLASGKWADKVEENLKDGIASGARGTPYSVVLKDGKIVGVINGAQPIENVEAQIEALLK